MPLGENLKKLREEAGFNQIELAEKLNISNSTLSLYEANKREPDYETLVKIAKFFNVTTDFLLGKTNTWLYPEETLHFHREDDILSELPEEARKDVEDYIKFKKQQYGIKD